MPSWSPGRRWRCAPIFSSPLNIGTPRSGRAAYLYLLISHIGAVGILLAFGVMAGSSGDYTFDAMRDFSTNGYWPTVAFLLALFGFGTKAGLLPLHVWLPEAHPVAPSPVSAMMSGIILKTAVYGMLRVAFDLLHVQLGWWGIVLLVTGLASALFGVIFATVQTDMKRLLAYLVDREHRPRLRRHWPGARFQVVPAAQPRRAGAHCSALPLSQPRLLQEPAVPVHRIGAARHRRAQPRQARRADPPHAVGRLAGAGRRAGLGRPAAAQRFRLRMAAAARLPVSPPDCRTATSTCCCRSSPAPSR